MPTTPSEGNTPLRTLLTAVVGVLLVATPARGPAAARTSPSSSAVADAFERLVRAQRLRNSPNSHAKSPERRAAERAGAPSEIRELTEWLAPRMTSTSAEELLDTAVRGADPYALEPAQAALRVLGARGVSWDRVREELPRSVAPWKSVLERCWCEGRALAERER